MAIRNNPGTVSSNVVFTYDVADTRNCYIGEPTTNYLTTALSPNNASKESFSGTVTDNAEYAPDGTLTAAKFVVNSGYVYEVLSIPSGTTINYSVWIKMLDGNTTTSVGPYIWSYGGPATGIVSRDLSGLSTSWKRFSMSYTTLSGQSSFAISYAATNGGVYGTYALWRPQLEYKNHATPFVFGTRSSTQGLLDISGYNRTINLSNMSFDSNAQMTFDGTDDYIPSIGSAVVGAGSSPYTVSVWVNRSRNNVGYEELLAQWTNANSGNSFFFGFNNSNVRFSDSWNDVSVSGAGNTNVWMNLVGVNTGTNAYIYLNGSLAATKGSALTYTGTGPFIIGRQGELAGEYFQGKLDKVQVYNRALSSDEVLQNYNSFKKRFNL